jgi:hypothetical protein
MSVGPLGGLGPSAAGAPFAQSKGSEIDRAKQDASSQQRKIQNDIKAENAAGIAATDGEDKATEDRDADGRRLWEFEHEDETQDSPEPTEESGDEPPRCKDPTGQSGSHLDLSG